MQPEDIENARLASRRLGALNDTGLLDSPPTAALDRLTRLAATLIDVPATFISLVAADRDYYISHCGLAEPLATIRELRGTTFCHYALVSGDTLAIDDTRADPVYRNVPTVESLGIGAYIGVPMKTASGDVIGSFCAVDLKARAWTARDRTVMEELAASAMREITLLEAIGVHIRNADEAQAARLEAEKAVATRREIVNSVAHDLRDPLNSILLALGPIEALQSDERVARSIAIVRRQTARMTRLLENLLDVARIEEGSLWIERESIEVEALVMEVVGDIAPMADAGAVSIDVDVSPGLPPFHGDRQRLAQALLNLMSNALKFTPRGGRARLAAWHEGDLLRLQVSDSGCGIDTALLDKVFEPFWQADPANRKGAGLGLHIVRGIVERHGGVIRVRSAIGAGAAFDIELPLSFKAG